MNTSTIICPHCHQPISVDQALSQSLRAEMDKEYHDKLHQATLEATKEADRKLAAAVKSAEAKATETANQELAFLKEQMTKQATQLKEARQAELALRQEKVKLEDEKKAFELEKQRQLDAERAKIKADAEKQAQQTQELKLMEMQKQLTDALHANQEVTKANEELRRKLQQGSQQTQGEVLELELETLLKTEFPMDEIRPVAKGVRGADVLQIVKDKQGRECGSILWELKNAQWSDRWLDKLREDQRTSKADVAVLVSINMPSTLKNKEFSFMKGVWVSSRPLCVALAQALRLQLNQVFVTKLAAVGKNEKMEVLYHYLSGLEFKQRVEAIIEAFTSLQDELEREKRWFATKWARQEKNIRKVIDQTHGMHGDLQSIMGASLPEIKQLQLDSGNSETTPDDQPTLL